MTNQPDFAVQINQASWPTNNITCGAQNCWEPDFLMNCFKLYRQKPFQEGALQALCTTNRWLILSVNTYLTKMHEFTCPKRKGKWYYKNSLFEIPYTDPTPCRSILVYWTNTTFVCSLSFQFVKPKQEAQAADVRSARKFHHRKLQKLVHAWTNWHFLPRSFLQ